MNGDLSQLAQYAIRTVLFCSLPMLALSLIVGLAVSIIQTVTQIQEATLAFVPKIITVFFSILIFGPWILSQLVEFTMNVYGNLGAFVN